MNSHYGYVEEEKKEEPIEILSDDDNGITNDNDNKGNYEDDDEPRRSGRKRKSTTMVIQGHVVKTANNYVLKGDTYSFGAFQADSQLSRPKKNKPAASKPKPSVPRTRPDYLVERQEHNHVIRKRILDDDAKRLNFMAKHMNVLEPFVEDKIKSILQHKHYYLQQMSAGKDEKRSVLGSQPDAVITELRDYQMIGLDWMADMHQKGMPFILGDVSFSLLTICGNFG